ncbi:guanine nucleotide binding protein, alpha subunit [Ephemerocybe angulata]|uniref:Guanine nucleotide binding protein, alpha subunit n=1 Tax=Ephemerocybe angulata TaxID=980116 RepID=A0A8H6HP65_9AGAR|nr:guanine nucleotide binding protein, alpha subunit [Tulosesus angulatus]
MSCCVSDPTNSNGGPRPSPIVLEDDPLAAMTAPPRNETPEERQIRETAEAEAKKISDEIDERLRRERESDRKKKRPVKLLLLGQSESGKTATLKNFQLTYARREWAEERAAWRSVIFLNFVRNVNLVVEHLNAEMSDYPVVNHDDSQEDLSSRHARTLPRLKFTDEHRRLRTSLQGLIGVQLDLERRLGSASLDMRSTTVGNAAPFDPEAAGTSTGKRAGEFSIHSSNGWKTALGKFKMRTPGQGSSRAELTDGDSNGSPVATSPSGGLPGSREWEDDIGETLGTFRDEIKLVWEDSTVQEVLARRKIRLEDMPGFFINDSDRIASRNYQPTDDDVVRARLRTLGVQEYKFIFDHGRTVGQEWRIYDVGGTRSSRAAWYPYFDDVDALIFLAPISPFDEKLAEDRKVNRLEDSYLLWASVCSCKLLVKAQLILFLNKCDLLQAKLQRGIRIRDSVTSYGTRINDLPTATKYFQQHFKEIARRNSPVQRPFYVHLTSVIVRTYSSFLSSPSVSGAWFLPPPCVLVLLPH